MCGWLSRPHSHGLGDVPNRALRRDGVSAGVEPHTACTATMLGPATMHSDDMGMGMSATTVMTSVVMAQQPVDVCRAC